MRTCKPTYVDRHGEKHETEKFYAELRTAEGRVLRLPGFANERLTESLGCNVQRLIDCRASGETLPGETARWIETLPRQTVAVLARWGLLQGHTLAGSKPLREQISDWKADLLARGNTVPYAATTADRVQRLTADCGFKFRGDIAAAKVPAKLIDYRKDKLHTQGDTFPGMAIKTANYYLRDLKSFCRWMMKARRATANPVEYLEGQNAKTEYTPATPGLERWG